MKIQNILQFFALIGILQTYSAPVNDECIEAVPIFIGSEYQGTTVGATRDFPHFPSYWGNFRYEGPLVWYRVTGTGKKLSASTCSIITNFDTQIFVFERGVCDRKFNYVDTTHELHVASNDDTSGCATNSKRSITEWCSKEGMDYFIAIGGRNGETGRFGLTVNEVGECTYPALNDNCKTATPIALNAIHQVSLRDATPSKSLHIILCRGTQITSDGPGLGLWYTFKGTGNHIAMATSNTNEEINFRVWKTNNGCDLLDTSKAGGWDDYPICVSAGKGTIERPFAIPTEQGVDYVLYVESPVGSQFAEFGLLIVEGPPVCSGPSTEIIFDFAHIIPGRKFDFSH